jgi:hypothetical protein
MIAAGDEGANNRTSERIQTQFLSSTTYSEMGGLMNKLCSLARSQIAEIRSLFNHYKFFIQSYLGSHSRNNFST